MKAIGVLGGMSAVATGEYYRQLNTAVTELRGAGSAEIAIYSVDFSIIETFIRAREWDKAAAYLGLRAQQVERAGAAVLLLATNTMHRVADEIQAAIGIPLLNIIDVTAAAAKADGVTTLGVLGTTPVMEPGFYSQRFARYGIELVAPQLEHQQLVERIIFTELTRGQVHDDSTRLLLHVVDDVAARGAEGVILGCTELGLAITKDKRGPLTMYDTTRLHVQAAARLALGLEPAGHPTTA